VVSWSQRVVEIVLPAVEQKENTGSVD